jgi:hypothetical protein
LASASEPCDPGDAYKELLSTGKPKSQWSSREFGTINNEKSHNAIFALETWLSDKVKDIGDYRPISDVACLGTSLSNTGTVDSYKFSSTTAYFNSAANELKNILKGLKAPKVED